MLTDLQKKTAQAIVNIFETGTAEGDYANVTLLAGDPGHLTYGRSQTTLGSGNLFLLLNAYVAAPGAGFGSQFQPFLERVANKDFSLDTNHDFRLLLRQAGNDPVMHTVQDAFFDRVYWTPAVNAATAANIQIPLGVAVVYDSTVHGSWKLVRDKTTNQFGSPDSIGQQAWIKHYVATRRSWLANHSIKILHNTVYRMDAMQQLINQNKWNLELPMTVRGVAIDAGVLAGGGGSSAVAHTEDNPARLLRLANPMMQGDDVKALQQALVKAGISVGTDGVFGKGTEAAVKQFQQNHSLTADGIVGPATRSALDLD